MVGCNWVRYSTWRRRLWTFRAASRMVLVKSSGVHEVGAGAGGQIAAVLYQLHAAQIDLSVALDGVFHGAAGLGEGGRIQDHHDRISRPRASSFGSRSNTSAHSKASPVSERPFKGRVFRGLVPRQARKHPRPGPLWPRQCLRLGQRSRCG